VHLPGKSSSVKQADLWDIFRKASKCVRNSTIVVSPHPLSPTPSTFSTRKTSENKEENHGDPQQADGDIKVEYSSD
jgi:hypothetical protein